MVKKSSKKRRFRGLPFNDYLTIWRAIRAGRVADWAEAERLGLCEAKGTPGRPAKKLAALVKRAKKPK